MPPMVSLVEEMLDRLFWALNRILDQEGISVLQWAFMLRALDRRNGVSFSSIQQASGESKDNVRRAAESLKDYGVGIVTPDPRDRRARIFSLTNLGRRRAMAVRIAFEEELLRLVGAREELSERVKGFTQGLWDATLYLDSADLASKNLIEQRTKNRDSIFDTSLDFVPLDKPKRSALIQEGESDEMLW